MAPRKQQQQQPKLVILHQHGHGIPIVFRGPYQTGAGIGNVFRSLYRLAIPLLKSDVVKKAGKSLGQQAIRTGMNVLRDVADGQHWKASAKQRLHEAGAEVGAKIGDKLRQMSGSGKQPQKAARMLFSHQNNPTKAAAKRKLEQPKQQQRKKRKQQQQQPRTLEFQDLLGS